MFCVGLTETFKELTKGYKPEKHLDLLESLCSATNFEAKKIRKFLRGLLKNLKISHQQTFVNDKEKKSQILFFKNFKFGDLYYSFQFY